MMRATEELIAILTPGELVELTSLLGLTDAKSVRSGSMKLYGELSAELEETGLVEGKVFAEIEGVTQGNWIEMEAGGLRVEQP
jgi:hypothetical protein